MSGCIFRNSAALRPGDRAAEGSQGAHGFLFPRQIHGMGSLVLTRASEIPHCWLLRLLAKAFVTKTPRGKMTVCG